MVGNEEDAGGVYVVDAAGHPLAGTPLVPSFRGLHCDQKRRFSPNYVHCPFLEAERRLVFVYQECARDASDAFGSLSVVEGGCRAWNRHKAFIQTAKRYKHLSIVRMDQGIASYVLLAEELVESVFQRRTGSGWTAAGRWVGHCVRSSPYTSCM
jgi:hypothetical protein